MYIVMFWYKICCTVLVLLPVLVPCEDIRCTTKESSLCTCRKNDAKPWSNEHDLPAPRPHNISLSWYIFQHGGQYIGVQICWAQKAFDFFQYVKGYYIEANSDNTEGYQCSVKNVTSAGHYLTFCFNVTRKPPSLNIYPDKRWAIDLSPIPMHRKSLKISSVFDSLSIPSCADSRDICQTYPCQDDPDTSSCLAKYNASTEAEAAAGPTPETSSMINVENTSTQSAMPPNENSVTLQQGLLIGILGFLCFTVVAVVFFIKKRGRTRQKLESEEAKRYILIIGDCSDKLRLKITNDFVETLKKCGGKGVRIVTNARQVLEVSNKGIVKWTMQKVQEADVVVFLIAGGPDSTRSEESDSLLDDFTQIKGALRAAETTILKASGQCSGKFLAVQVDECAANSVRVPSFCQSLCLRSNLKDIVQHALGPHYHCEIFNKYKRDFQRVLNMQQELLDNGSRDFYAQERNDLNVSMQPHQSEQISIATFNIIHEESPSFESNVLN